MRSCIFLNNFFNFHTIKRIENISWKPRYMKLLKLVFINLDRFIMIKKHMFTKPFSDFIFFKIFRFCFLYKKRLKKDCISLIVDKCSMLLQTIWLWSHTSHTKFYFNEFVANTLRDTAKLKLLLLRSKLVLRQ